MKSAEAARGAAGSARQAMSTGPIAAEALPPCSRKYGKSRARAKIGLLGAAVADHPDIELLMGSIAERGGAVSISSLRGDALTDPMVRLLRESGHKTFTIAPEAGSERLRRVLAKDLSNDQLFSAVALLARQHGFST